MKLTTAPEAAIHQKAGSRRNAKDVVRPAGEATRGCSRRHSSAGTSTTAGFTESNAPVRYYRVQAVRPLTP